MEKVKIVGLKYLDYTNKQGKHVNGYSVYGLIELYDENSQGYETFSCYFSIAKYNELMEQIKGALLDNQFTVLYNKFGQVEKLVPVIGGDK